jgi:anti-anti-sigma regulatory factor
MLMKALKVGLEQKGGLRFLNPSAPVARVLEISGLSSHAYSGSESDAADLLRK